MKLVFYFPVYKYYLVYLKVSSLMSSSYSKFIKFSQCTHVFAVAANSKLAK